MKYYVEGWVAIALLIMFLATVLALYSLTKQAMLLVIVIAIVVIILISIVDIYNDYKSRHTK